MATERMPAFDWFRKMKKNRVENAKTKWAGLAMAKTEIG